MLVCIIQEPVEIQDAGMIIISQVNTGDPELIVFLSEELKKGHPAQGREAFEAPATLTGEFNTDTHAFLVTVRQYRHTAVCTHMPVSIPITVTFFPRNIIQSKKIQKIRLRPDSRCKCEPVDQDNIFLIYLFFQLFVTPYVF